MNGHKMSFIMVWKVVGELHKPKNITNGSKRPQLVVKVAFHSSPALILTLLNPHLRSRVVKYSEFHKQLRMSEISRRGYEFFDGDFIQFLIILH